MAKRTIDRAAMKLRFIYLTVFFALSWPLAVHYSLPPARMEQADKVYKIIEDLSPEEGGLALLALDFGPNTIAENMPQAEAVIEHLLRRRIPFAVMSLYALASPFLESVPERIAGDLMKENPGEIWQYGIDWVNLGFQPGGGLFLQSIPKSEDLKDLFKKDAQGTPLPDLPIMRDFKTIEDIKMLAEFTGLAGMFNSYLQFFKSEKYVPLMVHGCTSITIPDAYIYLDSGQLNGLFEGIAGAAWYTVLLKNRYPARKGEKALLINTALGVAHLLLLALIVIGNIEYLVKKKMGDGRA